MNSNSNNNYNCNNHNNRYNSRYTKSISHISTCTYISFKPTYVGTLLESLCKPLRICLLALTPTVSLSCNTHHIYRVEYTDGSVEYYETRPDTTEQGQNIKSFFEINPDDIGEYEQH